jgi:DNA-directed RNA polymerase subunit RPC12/RpoP
MKWYWLLLFSVLLFGYVIAFIAVVKYKARHRCLSCGKRVKSWQKIFIETGSVVCDNCSREETDASSK